MVSAKPRKNWGVAAVRLDTQRDVVILDLGRVRSRSSSQPGVIRPPDKEAEIEIKLNTLTGKATHVSCDFPTSGLSPSDLQRLPWATFLAVADAADRGLRDRGGEDAWHLSNVQFAELKGERIPRRPRIKKRPGRRGHPDSHYMAVADRYRELRASGVTSPTLTIAREQHKSRDTVAGWIRECRKRELLPPARPGRPG